MRSLSIYKPLPAGLSFAGPARSIADLVFYKDLTWVDAAGVRHSKQEIFDHVLAMIASAKSFILLDMFLFNDFMPKGQTPYRKLAQEVTDALVAQKVKFPGMQIVVLTDPINTIYGGMKNHFFETMKAENIQVVFTKLEQLRDSNPLYSFFWNIFVKPFGNQAGSLLPNLFGEGRVSLRSYLSLLNFKANHRKVLICDDADEYAALITSANAHDGSSAHGNVAIHFKGQAVYDLLETEIAVLKFSGGPALNVKTYNELSYRETKTKIQILSERKIKDCLINAIDNAGASDKLSMAMFYLADRQVIRSLKNAQRRGVTIRLLLDPNKDAFGLKKKGIPNRQVASELVKHGISIRWCDTHGEQSHAKMLLVEYSHGQNIVILGSANFTRRNLNDLNLETDVAVSGSADLTVFTDIKRYFDLQWNNLEGKNFSLDYTKYADESLLKRILYYWMETTGMSTH